MKREIKKGNRTKLFLLAVILSLTVVSLAMAFSVTGLGLINFPDAVDVSLNAEASTDGDNAGLDLNSFEFKGAFDNDNTGYAAGSGTDNYNIVVPSQSSQILESGYIILLGIGLFSMGSVRRILKD